MSGWTFRALFLLLCATGSVGEESASTGQLLIRPLYVYEGLIKGVHDYFNNTCIILFHGASDPLETNELGEIEGLLNLQRYLSGSLNIRTSIMDFHMFRRQIGTSYFHIKRPLFILLNDLDEIRDQFSLVSKWITMAYPTWLLFLRDDTSFEDFLSDVRVPFNCVLMVAKRNTEGNGEVIRDVYRISKQDELRSMNFGTWDEGNGFRGPRLGLYQRRHDLHGRAIRVVSVHLIENWLTQCDNCGRETRCDNRGLRCKCYSCHQDPPVSPIVRDNANRTIGIGGFFGGVIQLLQTGMNCTFTYKEASSWGVRLPNDTWTGSMRMLIDDEADLAAAELMMTSDRVGGVEFTTPVYSTKARVYIKRPDTAAVKWNAYSAPFALDIWNSIALTIAVTGLAIAAIDAFSRTAVSIPVDDRSSMTTLSEILFFVFGAFCNQGMEPSRMDPIRMVQLSIHLTAVVVMAAYSAALISFLAIKTFAMPFTTMEGLLADGSYRFAVVGDSADYSLFQNTSDRILTVMFDELLTKEVHLPNNYFDGLRRVCQEQKYAFMTLDNMASVLQGMLECTLEPLDTMMQTTIAMAVPGQSPYRGIIDSNILLLRDSGILQRLLKTEWATNQNRPKSGWASVELEDAMPLLLFLLFSFFVTCLVLLLEIFIHKKLDYRFTIHRDNLFPPRLPRFFRTVRSH